jgi:hypothetical protein
MWLGPDDRTDVFGNVMGDYLARSSVSGGGIPGPASAEDRARVVGYFADGPGEDTIAEVNLGGRCRRATAATADARVPTPAAPPELAEA